MTARITSIEAYRDRIVTGDHQSDTARIERYILCNGPCTTRMIHHATGYSTATLSGIIKPLKDAGTLLEVPGKAPCGVTGRNAIWLVHKNGGPAQGSLF